ncbi:hypothetical protein ACFE04_023525 [Oxalis oulophora]
MKLCCSTRWIAGVVRGGRSNLSPQRQQSFSPIASLSVNFGLCSSRLHLTSCYASASASATASHGQKKRPASYTFDLSPSQRSDEWFSLRRDKLTTSTFSTALGFWKGTHRTHLWNHKVFASHFHFFTYHQRRAMDWGLLNESAAIDRYKHITARQVSFLGFAVHPHEYFAWLGASPDGLLSASPHDDHDGGGILEVKCPFNKGKPHTARAWSTVPFYYMPQVQGQMEILDREWVDLYCWTPNGSTIFRVWRDRSYWELIHGILREFWWENILPAREAMLLQRPKEAESYKPSSTHKQTGLAISKSIKLAKQTKLLCKEIGGLVQFYSI